MDQAQINRNYEAMQDAFDAFYHLTFGRKKDYLQYVASDDYSFHEEVLTALTYRLSPRFDYHVTAEDLIKQVEPCEVKHYHCIFDLLDMLSSVSVLTDQDRYTVQTFLHENDERYRPFLQGMILKNYPIDLSAYEVNEFLGRKAVPV